MLQFLALYAALCDPRWEAREAAESQLVSLIHRHPALYGPRLAELARNATEPEVRARCRRPLVVYGRWYVYGYVPRSVPVFPICDAWPVSCPVIPFGLEDVRDRSRVPPVACCQDVAISRGIAIEPGPHWYRYRAGTEQRVREMLRSGASWDECDDVLARAWKLEVRHRHDCNAVTAWTGWNGGYPK